MALAEPDAWMAEGGSREGLVPFPIYPHLTVWPTSRARDLAGLWGLCRAGRDHLDARESSGAGNGASWARVWSARLFPRPASDCAINAAN